MNPAIAFLESLRDTIAADLAARYDISAGELIRRVHVAAEVANEVTDAAEPSKIVDPAKFDSMMADIRNILRIYALPVQHDGAPTVETPAVSMDASAADIACKGVE